MTKRGYCAGLTRAVPLGSPVFVKSRLAWYRESLPAAIGGNNGARRGMFHISVRASAILGTSRKDLRFRPGRSPDMHHCAFCKNPLRPLTEWKGNDGRFYCSEFCADAGELDVPRLANPPEIAATTGRQH